MSATFQPKTYFAFEPKLGTNGTLRMFLGTLSLCMFTSLATSKRARFLLLPKGFCHYFAKVRHSNAMLPECLIFSHGSLFRASAGNHGAPPEIRPVTEAFRFLAISRCCSGQFALRAGKIPQSGHRSRTIKPRVGIVADSSRIRP
jgi:hypothetical protein